jgi:hypothetical protein
MNYQDNQIEKDKKQPSLITKFLWWCAGADIDLLVISPMQDRVKYAGIGGIVLCTGLLAAVSGGYAFLTIFGPKGNASDTTLTTSIGVKIMTLGFAIIWGLIIFNLDRFIVSSTGKGDGTDSITGKEFLQALPRIIIALILGFAISAPLEIRILKSEIDAELSNFQTKFEGDLNNQTDSVYYQKQKVNEAKKAEYEEKLAKYETELKVYSDQVDDLVVRQQTEMQDKRAYGFGPVAKKMQADIDTKRKDRDKFIDLKRGDIEGWRKQLDIINSQINKEMDELGINKKRNLEKAHKYDGLLKRIEISHEKGGIVPWVILFVFLSIEMGPIFFKMMMTKGVYDFMVENNNHKRNVENGIYREDFAYEGKDGLIHLEKYRFLEVENAKLEKEQKMKSLAILNQETIIGWEKMKSEAIKKDPSKFFTEGDESIRQNNA